MLGDISPLLGERAFLVAQEVVDEVKVSQEAARLCVRIVRCYTVHRGHRTRRESTCFTASDDGGEGARGCAGPQVGGSRGCNVAGALRAQPPRERRRHNAVRAHRVGGLDRR